MLILAFDPGIEHIGYAVLLRKEAHGKPIVECTEIGTIKTVPTSAIETRCLHIFTEVRGLLWKEECHHVAMEEYLIGLNRKSAALVLQAKGAMLVACGAARVSVHSFNPTAIKKHLTGNGSASKAQMREFVRRLFPSTEIKNEHECDALAVGVFALQTIRDNDREPELFNGEGKPE